MWGIEALDLDGYLARLAITPREPSRDALNELYEAHERTFTFDNIDVLLEQHPGVGLEVVDAKFVGRGRGGYCFEHATIMAAALERLGYRVQRHLGRVGDPLTSGRTHAVLWVDVDGERLLADPGFGMSLLRPLALADGASDDYLGWSYRLRRRDDTWSLERLRDGEWLFMHAHDELPVVPVDIVQGHHYTSTHPESHFRRTLMVAKHLDGRHVTVTHQTVTIRTPGAPTEHRRLREGELTEWLHALDVPLTDGETTRLSAVVETLPPVPQA